MWVLDLFQAVFGLIYVLVIPGFAATWALFPKKDEIDWIERAALTMALSLALSVLPVMFLNYWPGILVTPINVFLEILAVIILSSLIALVRIKKTR